MSLLILPLPIGILVEAIAPSQVVALGWVLYILIVSTVLICVVQAAVLLVVGHVRGLWTVLPVFAPLAIIGLVAASWGSRGDLEMSLAAAVAGTTVFVAFQVAWALVVIRHARKPETGWTTR